MLQVLIIRISMLLRQHLYIDKAPLDNCSILYKESDKYDINGEWSILPNKLSNRIFL